ETATGKLTKLDSINRIESQEATKYYSLQHFYIEKTNIGVRSTFDVSGKYGQHFNMRLYVVLPILASAADTSGTNCLAWYGIKYQKQISNRLDAKEKEEQYQKFANESQKDFERKDVNQFIYLNRIGNTNDHDGFDKAIKNNKKY